MAIEFFREGQLDDRFFSFVDGADRSSPTLSHHCCCHVSRWIQAVRRDLRWIEFARKIEREHDVRELALGAWPLSGYCVPHAVQMERGIVIPCTR